MRRFKVKAIYKSERTLTVTVKDGADPLKPDSWEEIEEEDEQDFYLYDTERAEEIE